MAAPNAGAPATKWQIWLLAARPRTLPAAIGPVLVGMALAWSDGFFAPFPAFAAAIAALLLQLLSNFANDYFDFVKGADTAERLGPPRAMATGLLSAVEIYMGMATIIGLLVLVGVYLIFIGGWPILVVGISSILAALLYTGGPFPFGYYGLGDLFVFIFFGLVAVSGTYFVQADTLSLEVVLAAVPVGLLITAILVVNNLRDIETDAQAGKRTLAVLIGRRNTQYQYLILLAMAYMLPLFLWIGFARSPAVLLPLLSLPLAVQRVYSVYTETGTALNSLLVMTAQLSFLYSLLLSVGLFL